MRWRATFAIFAVWILGAVILGLAEAHLTTRFAMVAALLVGAVGGIIVWSNAADDIKTMESNR